MLQCFMFYRLWRENTFSMLNGIWVNLYPDDNRINNKGFLIVVLIDFLKLKIKITDAVKTTKPAIYAGFIQIYFKLKSKDL